MKISINGAEINTDLKGELNRRIEKKRPDHQQIFVHINRPLPMSLTSRAAAKLLAILRS